jgi:hypothetical protein
MSTPSAKRQLVLSAACLAAVLLGASCTEPETQGMTEAETQIASELQAVKAELDAIKAASSSAVAPHPSAGPGVYFVNLRNGDTVASPLRVVFGLYGKGVAPALVEKDNTGHHHLLIDEELTAEEQEFAIPNDAQHLHFGGGQTETVIELPPGEHTLQLVFADRNHEPFDPPVMSERITITVK